MLRETARLSILLLFCLILSAGNPANAATARDCLVYIGTYAPNADEGIICSTLDAERHRLIQPRPAGSSVNPAALVAHPAGNILFATCLVSDASGKPVGGVAAFALDADSGQLREIDRRPSGGTGPCSLSIDTDGTCLLVANCGTATVACLSLRTDGRFAEATTVIPHQGTSRNSEQKPQAHAIGVACENRFAIAADLGLDSLFVYRLDRSAARLMPSDPPFLRLADGVGPRHLAFHPRRSFLYSVNELGNSMNAISLDCETGSLQVIQSFSTLPSDFQGESFAADVQVHPGGQYLYATNRGHDSIALFHIEETTGKLRSLGHVPSGGKFPRSLAIDPAGAHLIVANQKSNNLSLFSIDPSTGFLTPRGPPIDVPSPVCVRIVPRP